MAKKCKYFAPDVNTAITPACCTSLNEHTGEDQTDYDVHPLDAMDWKYCPFCGREIKLKASKK